MCCKWGCTGTMNMVTTRGRPDHPHPPCLGKYRFLQSKYLVNWVRGVFHPQININGVLKSSREPGDMVSDNVHTPTYLDLRISSQRQREFKVGQKRS